MHDGNGVYGCAGVFLALTWSAVIVRVVVRWYKSRSRRWVRVDDIFAVLAQVAFTTMIALQITGVRHAVDSSDLTAADTILENGQMTTYLHTIFYLLSALLLRFSISLFLFHAASKPSHRSLACALACLCAIFYTVWICLAIFQCWPVAELWSHDGAARCLTTKAMTVLAYAGSAVNAVIGWWLLLLATFVVWDTRMRGGRRKLVAIPLSIGLLASAVAIVRIMYINKPLVTHNLFDHAPTLLILSTIELGLGMIASSLPSLSTLFPPSRHSNREGASLTPSLMTHQRALSIPSSTAEVIAALARHTTPPPHPPRSTLQMSAYVLPRDHPLTTTTGNTRPSNPAAPPHAPLPKLSSPRPSLSPLTQSHLTRILSTRWSQSSPPPDLHIPSPTPTSLRISVPSTASDVDPVYYGLAAVGRNSIDDVRWSMLLPPGRVGGLVSARPSSVLLVGEVGEGEWGEEGGSLDEEGGSGEEEKACGSGSEWGSVKEEEEEDLEMVLRCGDTALAKRGLGRR